MNFVVGLTGGIGSGKSTVAHLFAELGVVVVDTDEIAHELTGPGGAAMPDITAAFGQSIVLVNGALDRGAMRRQIFSDPSAKSRLEAILHPMIRQTSMLRCQSAKNTPYVILVVPLLIESGAYGQQVNRILVVDCEVETQIARVMARNGFSRSEIAAILATQASREQRLLAADDTLSNEEFHGENQENLRARIIVLHQRYLDLSKP